MTSAASLVSPKTSTMAFPRGPLTAVNVFRNASSLLSSTPPRYLPRTSVSLSFFSWSHRSCCRTFCCPARVFCSAERAFWNLWFLMFSPVTSPLRNPSAGFCGGPNTDCMSEVASNYLLYPCPASGKSCPTPASKPQSHTGKTADTTQRILPSTCLTQIPAGLRLATVQGCIPLINTRLHGVA